MHVRVVWVKLNGSAKYVELSVECLRTRVQFPPPPPPYAQKTASWRFFFVSANGRRELKPRDAGRSRGFEPHAASLRSDLRLQAQGSPILLTRGKSRSDFLPFSSTTESKIKGPLRKHGALNLDSLT